MSAVVSDVAVGVVVSDVADVGITDVIIGIVAVIGHVVYFIVVVGIVFLSASSALSISATLMTEEMVAVVVTEVVAEAVAVAVVGW